MLPTGSDKVDVCLGKLICRCVTTWDSGCGIVARHVKRERIGIVYILWGKQSGRWGAGGRIREIWGSAPLLPPRGKEVGGWSLECLDFFFFLSCPHEVVVIGLLRIDALILDPMLTIKGVKSCLVMLYIVVADRVFGDC